MRFYYLGQTKYSDVALPTVEGKLYGPRCPGNCGRLIRLGRPQGPVRLHWQVDGLGCGASDKIYDFVWPIGCNDYLIANDNVLRHIRGKLTGFRIGPPIKMVDDPILHRPKRMTSRVRPRVWLPYEGPKLHDLIVEGGPGEIDYKLSQRENCKRCPECGRVISGFANGKPVIIRRRGKDTDLFSISGSGIYVTEVGRDILKAGKFSNLSMRLYGRIVG